MVLEKLKVIISDQFSIDADKITPETDFITDLGADSLDIVEFVMALEEEMDIEIPDDDVKDIRTVKDVVDYINSKK